MQTSLKGVCIAGIGACLPKERFLISDLRHRFGDDVYRIMESTGVEEIRIASSQLCSSDYCMEAARKLAVELQLDFSEFDGIIFVSQTPDYIMPATSVVMQHALGLPKESVAFDINYGCSGFIYGLFQAALLISSGSCSRVLLCNGDTNVRLLHDGDRANRMVLGDGFSATILESGNDEMCFCIKSDGSGYQHLIIPAGGYRRPSCEATKVVQTDDDGNQRTLENVYMNGFEIMSFAVREVPRLIKETLVVAKWEKDQVGTYALHQANAFMLQYLAKRAQLPIEAVPISLRNVGNNSSASIPIMLSLEYERLQRENRLGRVLACAFGVGLSCGAVTLDLSSTFFHAPWEL